MSKRSLLALPFSLLASLAAISLAAPAGAQSVAIAFEGDPEPGGSGGTYSALRAPVVNDSGVVAFRSSIASGSATSGVYRDAASGVAAIALTGDLAPDTGGGTFTSFGDPAINASGDVVFNATVGGGTANAGIWQSTPAGLLTIVTTQVAAPGTSGGFYTAFVSPIAINDVGEITFFANTSSPAATGGIFVEGDGVASRSVFLANQASPPDVINGTYFAFGRPAINASGDVATTVTIFDGVSTFTEAVVVDEAGGPRVVAFAGDAAPEVGGGTFQNFNFIGPPAIDDGGAVSFSANVNGGTALRGLFRDEAGALSASELQGEEAFGTSSGDFFLFQADRLTNTASGGLGFAANLLGSSVNAGAFFTPPGGDSWPIAVVGDVVPDGGGNTFRAFPSAPDVSDGGDAVFLARQGPAFDDVIVLAVPEPGRTLGLAITSLALLLGTARDRRRACAGR
ncbi:MAG: hypothetical protein NXI30_14425 [bacterium]|nr:hypothetical protein [bacterium]